MTKIKVNRIIKILIGSEFIYQVGAGFIAPVFAIFLVDSIKNGSAEVVGTATAIYWLTISTLRVPLAYLLDKKRGECDDFYSMVTGFSIMSLCYFLFLLAKVPYHIYLIELLMGIGGALAFTPWYGFFSRHIDKFHENLEWGMDVSLAGFGIAGSGFLTGIIVTYFGFKPIFIIGGSLCVLATLMLFLIGKHVKVDKKDGIKIRKRELNV